MKRWVLFLLAAAALAAVFPVGSAAQTVRFLGDLETPLDQLAPQPGAGCTMGNFRVPGGVELPYGDVISCRAELDSTACGCPGGWAVAELHLLLANLGAGPVSGSLYLAVVGQGLATWPSGCPEAVPGYYGDLAAAFLEITLPDPGYYEVSWTTTAPCAFFGHEYFFECWLNAYPELHLVLDAAGPRPCEVLFAQHMGERWWWTDVFFDDFWAPTSGAPIWWVDAVCCEPPVSSEARSWDSLKAFYRQGAP